MPKKNKSKENSSSVGENFFVVSPEKKKKLLGIFLVILALLIFLSILTYSRYDESYFSYKFLDLFGFGSNPELANKAATTHNWLGILGAYVSHFLIRSTIGYFSIIFPVIMFIWGYSILRKVNEYKLPLYLSNFLIVMGILLSTFFGMIQFTPEISLLTDYYELSGKIGFFFGTVISRLLGGLGSIIFLSTAMLVTMIIAFDFKFSSVWEFLKSLFSKEEKDEEIKIKVPADDKSDENILKIKNLRGESKFKSLFK
ncbi:MAG: DNA translocase FtsK, partial [Ignavibacteriales bacterium]